MIEELLMQLRLTWNDLLIQNISEPNAHGWLGCWQGIIKGKVAPVFMSKFGDWFLRLPDGSTNELSVIEGTYLKIASTPDEFSSLVNTAKWQEEHLMSLIIQQLHERKIVPQEGQCYAFAPHPILTGRIDIDRAMLMDIGVWQHICAQTINVHHEELKTV
ncbi:MAG: hypothetical protein ABSE90_04140 [Verrucomicrobiota bacterium]